MQKCVIGVDVGGTNIRMGAITPDMKLHGAVKISSAGIRGEKADDMLLQTIRDYMGTLQGFEPQAVAIGFPGPLNRERTLMYNCANIPGLRNLDLSSYSTALGMPVYGEHDASMLMYYDVYFNHIPTEGLGIAYYIGTGIGNAIMIDGKIHTGKNGVAGEIGHTPVLDHDDPCGCGHKGCLELYAAGRGFKDVRDKYYPGESLDDLYGKYGLSEPLDHFLHNVAAAIVIEVQILDPDYIVLGGGCLNTVNFPMDYLQKLVREMSLNPYPGEGLKFVVSKQDDPFNGVNGAGYFAYLKLKEAGKTF